MQAIKLSQTPWTYGVTLSHLVTIPSSGKQAMVHGQSGVHAPSDLGCFFKGVNGYY